MKRRLTSLVTLLTLILAACTNDGSQVDASSNQSAPPLPSNLERVTLNGRKLRVVASTILIADVLHNVGGDHIVLNTLIPAGQDPHTYEPTPAEIANLETADIIFVNGFGFEEAALGTIEAVGQDSLLVIISAGITPRVDQSEHEEDDEEDHAIDPHVWMDPTKVQVWAANAATVLSALDPANADAYQANASAYRSALVELDTRIREELAVIPDENRLIVTDHDSLGYFADRYGFEIIGTILPGVSSSVEANAGNMAALTEAINQAGVSVIFVESVSSEELSHVIAQETGREIKVMRFYGGSPGRPGSGAETYIEMMNANVQVLLDGLLPAD